MLKFFRLISIFEGLSYLTILCVAFEVISREYVFAIGMGHGILFMAYIILSLPVSHKQGWNIFTWLLVFLASIIPFAFILVEIYLQKTVFNQAQPVEA